jgi:UPF0755 protein
MRTRVSLIRWRGRPCAAPSVPSTGRDFIDTLIQGKPILHSITFPEGLTSEQIVQRIRDNEILTGDIGEPPREGTFLPDTYKFERGETRQQVINRMQRAQRDTLNQIWARRSPELPIKTPQELVILRG